MNPIILTKISKHMMIGSVSAYLSFASKHNPIVQKFFYYSLAGIIVAILIVLLWEGRDVFEAKTEESLLDLVVSHPKQKRRNYFLSNRTRLELVIVLIVISVCSLVGSI